MVVKKIKKNKLEKEEDGEKVKKKIVKKKATTKKRAQNKKKEDIVKKIGDDSGFSDDKEIPIGIKIKSKINKDLDKLTEIVGEKDSIEEEFAPLQQEDEDGEMGKNLNKKKSDGLWDSKSDAVQRVIAHAEETRHVTENQSMPEPAPVENKSVRMRRSVNVYKKIAYFFLFLVVALVGVVFYFTFVRITVILIPNQERVSNNMIFDIVDLEKKSENNNDVIGVVKEVEIEYTKQYNATDEEIIGKEAVGIVTIVNNYTKNQPLVATTRILSADGKLFRTKNTVNVPAGGSIEVDVYADEPSPEMAINPTKFTIPGLWAGLQDKIFAENSEKIIYRQKVKKRVSKDDIENGIRDLKQALLKKAKTEINESYNNYSNIIYKIDENSIISDIDSEVGEEVKEINITMKADVVIVAFNNKKTEELAQDRLIGSLSSNKELISFDAEDINYSLNNFDVDRGEATINATFEGKITLKKDSNIIEKDKIIGLNKDQIDAYLNNIPDLAGHEIKFYPSFVTKIPNMIEPGRINIEIRR